MVYSLDLRKKALNYIEKGGTRLEASKIFGVTVPTLANWLSREKQQDLAPRMNGSKPSKIDIDLNRIGLIGHSMGGSSLLLFANRASNIFKKKERNTLLPHDLAD